MAINYSSQKVKELDKGQKIQIKLRGSKKHPKQYSNASSIIIESPLPETFGFSTGSQFGSPFASYRSNGLLTQIGAFTGFSNNFGLFTEKFYEGPQESQVTFDMKFDTWEDSVKDILHPVMHLMIFSTGYAESKLTAAHPIINSLTNAGPEAISYASKELHKLTNKFSSVKESSLNENIFQMLHKPPDVTISFGNIYTLTGMYISNVSLQFSNTLDHNFLPMSCTTSITADFKQPLTQGRVKQTFGF